MRYLFRICGVCLILVLMGAGYIAWQTTLFLNTPPSTHDVDILFDVEQGAPFARVARQLEEKGIITDAKKFRWLARYKEWDNKLQAGRFALNTNWMPARVLEQLVNGQPVLHRITLREGLTWWETAKILADAGFVRYEDFRDVITDPEFLRHYGIPFPSAEGFLLPETYLLKKADVPDRAAARSIAGRMVDTFWQKTAPLWVDGKKPTRQDIRRIIILASIVEKETAVPQERTRVAGVYTNRLEKSMLLQADPTVIYGLGPAFQGNLKRVHLNDTSNVYNTYQRADLPPGPICSPGVASIQAALHPEKHEYLYFVAKTDGGEHDFSKTLEEHNRAVRRYLNNRKKK